MQMRAAGRTISAEELLARINENCGTPVWEVLSTKGPWRLWWTSEDVAALSPFPYYARSTGPSESFYDETFREFANWFADTYADPVRGRALLVDFPDDAEKRKSLFAPIKDREFITTLGRRKKV